MPYEVKILKIENAIPGGPASITPPVEIYHQSFETLNVKALIRTMNNQRARAPKAEKKAPEKPPRKLV